MKYRLVDARNAREREILDDALMAMRETKTGRALVELAWENRCTFRFADQDGDAVWDGQTLLLSRRKFVMSDRKVETQGIFEAVAAGLCRLRHDRGALLKEELSPRDAILFEKLRVADVHAGVLQVAWEMSKNDDQRAVGALYLGKPHGAKRRAAAAFIEAIHENAEALANGDARRAAVAAFFAKPDVNDMRIESAIINAAWKGLRRTAGKVSLSRVVRLCFADAPHVNYLETGGLERLAGEPYGRLRAPGAAAALAALEMRGPCR